MHHTSSPPSLSDHDIDICYWPKGGGAPLFVLFVHASTSAKKYEYISGKCFSLIVLSDIWFGKFSFCSPLAQRVHLCFNLVTYIMHFIMIHSCVNTGQWSGTHVALFPIVDCTLTTPSYHYQHPLRGSLQYALTLSTIVSMMLPSCGGVQWLSSNLLIVCGCFFCSSPQFIFSPSVCPCRDQGSGQSRLGHLCERSAVGHHVNTTQCTLGFASLQGKRKIWRKDSFPHFSGLRFSWYCLICYLHSTIFPANFCWVVWYIYLSFLMFTVQCSWSTCQPRGNVCFTGLVVMMRHSLLLAAATHKHIFNYVWRSHGLLLWSPSLQATAKEEFFIRSQYLFNGAIIYYYFLQFIVCQQHNLVIICSYRNLQDIKCPQMKHLVCLFIKS